jgi:integrase
LVLSKFEEGKHIMAKLLTAAAIQNLKPDPARRREIHAGSGLYVVIQPQGKKSWAYRYRAPGGQNKKLTIGPADKIGLKEARALADEAKAKLRKGIDPAAELAETKAKAKAAPAAGDTVGEVIKEFVARYAMKQTRPRSWKEAERLLTKECAPWVKRRLADITRRDLVRLIDGITDRGSSATALQAFRHISTLFGWATRREIIPINPCLGAEAPKAGAARERCLNDAELSAVWRGCDALGYPFADIIKLLILTGARKSEVAELRWAELDLKARLWVLPSGRAKNGAELRLPLPDAAIAILEALPRFEGGDFLFSYSAGQTPIQDLVRPKHRLDTVVAEIAGEPIAHWTIHDIRRSAASGMASIGVGMHIVEKILGHRSGSFKGIVSVYQRYDHQPEMKAALARWADHVSALVSGSPGSNVVAFGAKTGK